MPADNTIPGVDTMAATLKAWRTKHRLTQAEVAEIAGRSTNAYRSWESGRVDPPVDRLLLIRERYPDLVIPQLVGDAHPKGPSGDDTLARSPEPHLPSATADHLLVVERPEGVSLADWRRITADYREFLEWKLDRARHAARRGRTAMEEARDSSGE